MSSRTAKNLSSISALLILFATLSSKLALGTVTAIEVVERSM